MSDKDTQLITCTFRISKSLKAQCDMFLSNNANLEWSFSRLVRNSLESYVGTPTKQVAVVEKPPARKGRTPKPKEVRDAELNTSVRNVVAAYAMAYKNRYKANPTLTGKDLGVLKTLIKDLGENKMAQLVQVYVQMEDKWFITKKHDITNFQQNISKIGVSLQTGQDDARKKTTQEELEEYQRQEEIRRAALSGERLPTT